MSNIVPFEQSAGLPAFMKAAEGNLANLVGSGGFPVVSIKGKVFTLLKDGAKSLITKPDAPDEPASAIEVVILAVGPNSTKSARIFYAKGYEEGSTEKPDCYSDSGEAPAADAVSPQCNKCAICKHNVKGSKPTAQNPEGKACASAKRLAIATPDNLDEPMLLRAPGASIVPLSDYLKVLKTRGVPNTYGVVTRIGFNYTVAHPELTFKPVGFVTEAQYMKASEVAQQEVIASITGASTPTIAEDAVVTAVEPKVETPAPAPAAPAKKAKTKILMEGEDETPAPAKAAKPAPVVDETPKTMDVDEGLSATLDDLDFDD